MDEKGSGGRVLMTVVGIFTHWPSPGSLRSTAFWCTVASPVRMKSLPSLDHRWVKKDGWTAIICYAISGERSGGDYWIFFRTMMFPEGNLKWGRTMLSV